MKLTILIQNVLQRAQPVAAGIIPKRGLDHRPGEKLMRRQAACPPGQGLFVPVMAPHYVKNGPAVSISLSITWRSDWSFAEADARAFNHVLRKIGLKPKAPGRFPKQNKAKAIAWRALRKLRSA